jgi:hypothetical protein
MGDTGIGQWERVYNEITTGKEDIMYKKFDDTKGTHVKMPLLVV